VSVSVIVEVVRNLQRKAPAGLVLLEAFLTSAHVQVVRNPEDHELEPWLQLGLGADARIAAAATIGEVDHLCTGDRKLREVFNDKTVNQGAVTPRELLTLLGLP
jgi:hypothetical protein